MRLVKMVHLVYQRCPVWFQNILITLYGLLLFLQRYGRIYRHYLKLYVFRDNSSYRKVRRRQNRELIRLIRYAVEHSQFYRDLYKNIDLTAIRSVDDIGMLPIITKQMLKDNLNQIYTLPKWKGLKFHTGGTTGTPITIVMRRQDMQKRQAYLDAFKIKCGFLPNQMRSARFSGRNIIQEYPVNHIFWRTNYITKQRYYSTYYLTNQNLMYYVDNLNEYQPEALDGFVSAIYTIAKYIDDNHINLKFTPKVIFTTSETVLPIQREMIEKVFRCPLRDQYASNDGAPFITQCRYGVYHENIDTGVFEHSKTPLGMKLIVTSFHSYGTPLIRYDIGDYIMESDKKICECGSCHPVIQAIEGRSSDYICTKQKGNISQTVLSLVASELPECFEQLQLIQEDESRILVKVVMREEVQETSYHQLIDKLCSYLGADMEFVINKVDRIDREKSGKSRMIINRMEELK